LIAGVALWALLAGCPGPSGPSAAERSICKTVRTQIDASITVFVSTSFVHDLIRSDAPTFQRLGEAIQRTDLYPVGKLDARCSALGL